MTVCERARLWASLELDAEITELEEAALRLHLEGCADCRGYAARVRHATGLVRAAPPAAPARGLAWPLPRTRRVQLRLVASAAAVLAALALGGAAGLLSGSRGTTVHPGAAASHRLLIEQSLLALAAGGRVADAGHSGRVIPS